MTWPEFERYAFDGAGNWTDNLFWGMFIATLVLVIFGPIRDYCLACEYQIEAADAIRKVGKP